METDIQGGHGHTTATGTWDGYLEQGNTNTMPSYETQKSLPQFIKECFLWSLKAWPGIFLGLFIYFHVLILALFPESEIFINTWIASIYQIIGAAYVLVQINESLKTLKNIDLIKSIKQYVACWPKRKIHHTVIDCKLASVSCTASMSGTFSHQKSSPETLEEKVERLSNRISELEKKVDGDKKDLIRQMKENQKTTSKQINAIRGDIKTLNGNLVDTVIGDYKKAIFGVLMIMYGICVPIFNL